MKMNKLQSMARLDYKQSYLNDYRRITGITDLTLQDVIGAMYLMFKDGFLAKARAGEWSKN